MRLSILAILCVLVATLAPVPSSLAVLGAPGVESGAARADTPACLRCPETGPQDGCAVATACAAVVTGAASAVAVPEAVTVTPPGEPDRARRGVIPQAETPPPQA